MMYHFFVAEKCAVGYTGIYCQNSVLIQDMVMDVNKFVCVPNYDVIFLRDVHLSKSVSVYVSWEYDVFFYSKCHHDDTTCICIFIYFCLISLQVIWTINSPLVIYSPSDFLLEGLDWQRRTPLLYQADGKHETVILKRCLCLI